MRLYRENVGGQKAAQPQSVAFLLGKTGAFVEKWVMQQRHAARCSGRTHERPGLGFHTIFLPSVSFKRPARLDFGRARTLSLSDANMPSAAGTAYYLDNACNHKYDYRYRQ